MSAPAQFVWDSSTEKAASGVSWSAILAGAVAAAALALILIVLGVGLGMSAFSPWPSRGLGASVFGWSTVTWLVVTQIVASVAGGYLAGRLRVKWTAIHTDEVYFRDTAHGFLAWAIAALVSASLVGGAISSITAAGAGVTAASATLPALGDAADRPSAEFTTTQENQGANAGRARTEGSRRYLVDSLFRADPSTPDTTPRAEPALLLEVAAVFANSIHSSSLPLQDQQYLAQVVSKHTGLSPADATKRVTDTFAAAHDAAQNAENNAREAADKARKAMAYAALWMFISLLCGAFCASLAATYGGRQRDHMAHTVMPE